MSMLASGVEFRRIFETEKVRHEAAPLPASRATSIWGLANAQDAFMSPAELLALVVGLALLFFVSVSAR
jgi:hypothetical protein